MSVVRQEGEASGVRLFVLYSIEQYYITCLLYYSLYYCNREYLYKCLEFAKLACTYTTDHI